MGPSCLAPCHLLAPVPAFPHGIPLEPGTAHSHGAPGSSLVLHWAPQPSCLGLFSLVHTAALWVSHTQFSSSTLPQQVCSQPAASHSNPALACHLLPVHLGHLSCSSPLASLSQPSCPRSQHRFLTTSSPMHATPLYFQPTLLLGPALFSPQSVKSSCCGNSLPELVIPASLQLPHGKGKLGKNHAGCPFPSDKGCNESRS